MSAESRGAHLEIEAQDGLAAKAEFSHGSRVHPSAALTRGLE
jgi:hypothetical protein